MSLRNRIIVFVCCVLCFGSALSASEPASTWPQWRGPDRDSMVQHQEDWPSDFGGLEPLWRIEMGPGYPGPIVAPDHVFVAETKDGKTEVVSALERKTGKVVWQTSWPGEGSVPFFASANGDWIRSTPSYDGESLFVGGMNEVLVSLDASTGEERWRVDFPSKFGTDVPAFGFSSSPLVDGDHLYVQAANSLIKLDKRTGEVIWRTLAGTDNIMEAGAFSSPIITELGGGRQLLAQTRTELHGVEMETGAVLWSQEVPHFRGMNILTPSVYGEGIFTSSYGHKTFFYEINKAEDGSFSVAESWTNKVQAYMSSPVIIDGHAYLHLRNQRLTCIDLETGEGKWTTKPFGKYWSMAAHGDKILALDEGGELILFRANPEEFELLARHQVADQETWGHIAIAGNELYVRELKAIAAYRWADKAPTEMAAEQTASASSDTGIETD